MKNNLKMKSQLLYIDEAMSNYNIDSEDDINPVDYLKSLDLEVFLNNKTTSEILLIKHYENFQNNLKHILKNIYERNNVSFRDNLVFGKDWDNKEGEIFSEVVYNHISINYDLTIFYDSPGLAKELF
tara:strand:- start:322 stop:702 length:381 start_codon:yes stop_codon:yes gene_type:complete